MKAPNIIVEACKLFQFTGEYSSYNYELRTNKFVSTGLFWVEIHNGSISVMPKESCVFDGKTHAKINDAIKLVIALCCAVSIVKER